MNLNEFSPYVRVALYSHIEAPFKIRERTLFDFEIILIEDGMWNLNIYGQDYLCKKNDVIFIPPDALHSMSSVEGYSVTQPHIHFDVIYDDKSPDLYVSFIPKDKMNTEQLSMIRENCLSSLPSPLLNIPDIEYFKRIFYDILETHSKKNDFYQLKSKEKMLRLLEYILRENTKSNHIEEANDIIIELVKDYIDQNYHNIITLEKLELQFSYNKFYISRMFSEKYSCSIIKYYNNLRLSAAKRYLEKGKSVTEVSEILNFSSIYAFSRFFKNHTGLSPSKYINII